LVEQEIFYGRRAFDQGLKVRGANPILWFCLFKLKKN